MNFDIYINPIIQPEALSRIEIYIPDKIIKALTDLIAKELGKRMKRNKLKLFKEWLKESE